MSASSQHRIYVASSWRNAFQQHVVLELRLAGHEVYDFRNPRPGDHGFAWSQIEPDWQEWNAARFRTALDHPLAVSGFASDFYALKWCDTCVLVLPCGRSAHLELGWAVGAGKRTAILLAGENEPELMYKMVDKLAVEMDELVKWVAAEAVPAWSALNYPHCETCTCWPSGYRHREGNLELRVNDPGGLHPTLEIVRWGVDSCWTVALWDATTDGPREMRFIGDRPFDCDAAGFWKLAREGQEIAKREPRGNKSEG